MSNLIEAAAKKHKTWINIVNSFGCNKNVSEDIVQEMYIYLIRYQKEGKNIWYDKGEVNYYYIFKQLRGIYVDYVRVNSKVSKVSLDALKDIPDILDVNPDNYEEMYEKMILDYTQEIDNIYWYDKKVFELIAKGKSVAKLSRETDIGYYSLYNTYNRVKKNLKHKLL